MQISDVKGTRQKHQPSQRMNPTKCTLVLYKIAQLPREARFVANYHEQRIKAIISKALLLMDRPTLVSLSGWPKSNLNQSKTHHMIFQPEIVQPVAPLTGALLYPLDEILDLARGIVHNLEKHHKILLRAAQDRDDDEEEAIQLNNLVDINLTIYAIDPVRWRETHETNNPDYEWTTAELEGLTHPRKAEEGLLGLCRIPRAEFVIQAAIERRKSKRGIAPLDDPYWRKEDALMNLLQFFSNWSSGGLFVPS